MATDGSFSDRNNGEVKKIKLFDSDDSDTDPENYQLTINEEYAAKYNKWRSKEELQKLKAKYGDVSSSSSSDEEEDHNGDRWTPNMDRNWYRAQTALLINDPRIHDKNYIFFDDPEDEEDDSKEEESDSDSSGSEEESSKKKKKKKDKVLTIRDHQSKVMAERGGTLSDSDEEKEEAQGQGLSYHDEQEAIRKSLKKAVADSDDDDEDIIKNQKKSRKEKEKDKEEYLQFLRGEVEIEDMVTEDKELAKELKPLRDHIHDPNLPEDDKYLWNFFINKAHRFKSDDEDSEMDEEALEEELFQQVIEEEQEQYEQAFNFRFQEPDKNFIRQYQRRPEETIRQEVKKRVQKRKEIKERKKMAEEERRQEIRHLRRLMKEELQSRVERVMKECPTGVDFTAEELKGDFNPKAYDKMMQAKFGNIDSEDDEGDDEKPDLGDLDDIISIGSYENFEEEEEADLLEEPEAAGSSQPEEEKAGSSGLNGGYDADEDENAKSDIRGGFDPSWLPEFNQSSRRSRRKRKRTKFQQAIDAEKPKFTDVFEKYQDSETPWDDYLKDYYNLDYKEFGFRYRNVVANDYGLQPGEMLWLPARELNAWASMKKIMEQKPDDEEMRYKHKYQSGKMQRKMLNIMPSLKKLQDEQYSYEDIRPSTLRKQKLEQQVARDDSDGSEQPESQQSAEENIGISLQTDPRQSPKKKKKRNTDVSESVQETVPCKKKKKRQSSSRKLLKCGAEEIEVTASQTIQDEGKKKKKKKEKSGHVDHSDSTKNKTEVTEQLTEVQTGEGKKNKKKRKLETENQERASEAPNKKKRTENPEIEMMEDTTGEIKMKKKKKKAAQEKETSVTTTDKGVSNGTGVISENLTAEEKNKEGKKKKKKKHLSEGGEHQQATPKSGKKKQKQKRKGDGSSKTKGYVAIDRMQDSRLGAFHIDPRKFKYTKHRIGPSEPDQNY